jgi:hypothetical protein
MTTELEIYGPIEIVCPTKFIDKNEKREFLECLDAEGISMKQGCYIFALRAGKGYCPWYVGKSTKSFKTECMEAPKLQHYNAVLSKGGWGTPVMFFAAPKGQKNKVPKNICDEMEGFLIQSALYENPELRNVQKAKVPEWGIDGVIRGGQGQPTKSEVGFRKMMGL